jgi:hypothetical protein
MSSINYWDKFLNETGICVSGYGGNRPCDNGCPCDRCMSEWITTRYENWLLEHGYNDKK